MSDNLRGRIVAACAFGLAAVPYHVAYGSVLSAIVVTCISLAIGLTIMLVTRSKPVWQYGLTLAIVGFPLAYIAGIGTALVGLIVATLGYVAGRRGELSPAGEPGR